MTDENWLHAFNLSSRGKRQKYYSYLLRNENYKVKEQEEKEERRKKYEAFLESKANLPKPPPKYTIFLRIYDTAIDRVRPSHFFFLFYLFFFILLFHYFTPCFILPFTAFIAQKHNKQRPFVQISK